MHFFLKAIVSGLIVLITGVIVTYAIDKYRNNNKKDNSHDLFMDFSLFLTGFFAYSLAFAFAKFLPSPFGALLPLVEKVEKTSANLPAL